MGGAKERTAEQEEETHATSVSQSERRKELGSGRTGGLTDRFCRFPLSFFLPATADGRSVWLEVGNKADGRVRAKKGERKRAKKEAPSRMDGVFCV